MEARLKLIENTSSHVPKLCSSDPDGGAVERSILLSISRLRSMEYRGNKYNVQYTTYEVNGTRSERANAIYVVFDLCVLFGLSFPLLGAIPFGPKWGPYPS